MSESFVQLNTDGVGKKIDTWTELTNNQHRQAMVIADPSATLNVAFVTAANALKVDASATTQPVSGSITVLNASIPVTQSGVWTTGRTWTLLNTTDSVNVGNFPATQAVTQSGTWTVQPGNTPNTSPWLMTINQGGNSATVDAAGELAVADAELELAQGSPTSGQFGPLIQGAVTTAAPAYTTAQTSPLSLTTVGNLRVDGSSVTQPVSGTVTVTQATAANLNATIAPLTNTSVVKAQLQDNAGTAITLGQKVMASSVPVVLASDQTTINVAPATPNISTYTATITALATAALATDIFTVTGSATKLVKIRRYIISGSQTTAGSVRFITLKRSTADTAGTSTNPTAVPHDSNNAAATAVITAYTANPTLGTLVGNLTAKSVVVETAAASTDFQGWDFTQDEAVQPIALRGIAQQWAINLGGVTVAGSAINISVVWTEE